MSEREIVVRFRLPESPRQRWLFAIVLVVVCFGAAVYATVPNTFAAGDLLSAQKLNDNFSNLDGRIAAIETASAPVPSGTIIAFGGTTAPAGYLACDGASVTQASYPALFAAIGTAWGSADATHFNVPDLRGRFPRGDDQGAGVDPDAASRIALVAGGATGNNVGSYQLDQFASHFHTYNRAPTAFSEQVSGSSVLGGAQSPTYAPVADKVNAAGGSESRPKNAYVRYLIKL